MKKDLSKKEKCEVIVLARMALYILDRAKQICGFDTCVCLAKSGCVSLGFPEGAIVVTFDEKQNANLTVCDISDLLSFGGSNNENANQGRETV